METTFGKLVANPSMDDYAPGICISLDDGENGERPLAVVEQVKGEDGAISLRLVAWSNINDFDSYETVNTYF